MNNKRVSVFSEIEKSVCSVNQTSCSVLNFITAMSWDDYIDNLIAQSKDSSGHAHADKACIIGLDGGAKWNTDQHPCAFKLEPHEAAVIANCFKKKDFTRFMSCGICAESTTYTFLREFDGKTVYARKKNVDHSLFKQVKQQLL
ncbi:hypothetical protein OS493_028917 [Desmophyllum pertusum]|uniref:Profilin n=1 Tax=Desmophyllum pertusum TaxID=174260 RepID=A0A9X0CVU7_9CNID|nr:hypothetical protein OS493_028917 [Desmophyllum pertusum]